MRQSALSLGLMLVALSMAVAGTARAVTLWTGPEIVFSKPAFADWTLPENQDRITPNVWITRKDTQGIFNIKVESFYSSLSPQDTLWAFEPLNPGQEITATNYENLVFFPWREAHGACPGCMVGRVGVVHLVSEDIYFDIRFTGWGQGPGGGGAFAYFRSTPPHPLPLLPRGYSVALTCFLILVLLGFTRALRLRQAPV